MLQLPQGNKWIQYQQNITSNENIPCPRSGSASAIMNQCLFFIFGGLTSTEAKNDFYYFDIKDQIWIKIHKNECFGDIPSERSLSQIVCYQEKIYLFGGTSFNVENLAKNQLFEFQLKNKTWRTLDANVAPSERYGHSMIIDQNSIYIFGGVKFIKQNNRLQPEFLNDLWKFSLIDKLWIKIKTSGSIPQARYRHTSLVIENKLYIVGGTSSISRFGQIQCLDMKSLHWNALELEAIKDRKKKNLFQGRYGHASFKIGSMIYIYGGFDDILCNDALQLDISKNQWKRFKFRGDIAARDFLSFAYTESFLVIFGGKKNKDRLNDLHQWNFTLERNNEQFCTLRQDIVLILFQLLLQHRLLELPKEESLSDVIILDINNEKILFCHSSLLKVRCLYLFNLIQIIDGEKMIRIEANETVIKNIFEYIYSGSCNYELSLNSPIDSLLYWANRIEMPQFLRQILEILLVNSYQESDYDIIHQIISKSNNIIFDQARVMLEQRIKIKQTCQKDRDKIMNLINCQTSLINSLFKSSDQFYDDMKKLQDDKTSDVRLELKNVSIDAHSFLLSQRCEYFKALFKFKQEQKIVKLDIFQQENAIEILKPFLNYLYLGYKELQKQDQYSQDTLIALLSLQQYFVLNNQSYSYLLQDSIVKKINLSNCISYLKIGDRFQAQLIIAKTLIFMGENLQQIEKQFPHYLDQIEPEYLVELFKQIEEKH